MLENGQTYLKVFLKYVWRFYNNKVLKQLRFSFLESYKHQRTIL